MVIRPPVNPDLTPDALPLGAIDPDAVNLGVFSRPELRARGLTDADLRRKVRRGELLVPRRGWYAQPEADPDAVAAAKRYGALSCASALTKHKLWVPPGYDSLHVRAGTLVDVLAGRVLADQLVTITDGRITAVKPFTAQQLPNTTVAKTPALQCQLSDVP